MKKPHDVLRLHKMVSQLGLLNSTPVVRKGLGWALVLHENRASPQIRYGCSWVRGIRPCRSPERSPESMFEIDRLQLSSSSPYEPGFCSPLDCAADSRHPPALQHAACRRPARVVVLRKNRWIGVRPPRTEVFLKSAPFRLGLFSSSNVDKDKSAFNTRFFFSKVVVVLVHIDSYETPLQRSSSPIITSMYFPYKKVLLTTAHLTPGRPENTGRHISMASRSSLAMVVLPPSVVEEVLQKGLPGASEHIRIPKSTVQARTWGTGLSCNPYAWKRRNTSL